MNSNKVQEYTKGFQRFFDLGLCFTREALEAEHARLLNSLLVKNPQSQTQVLFDPTKTQIDRIFKDFLKENEENVTRLELFKKRGEANCSRKFREIEEKLAKGNSLGYSFISATREELQQFIEASVQELPGIKWKAKLSGWYSQKIEEFLGYIRLQASTHQGESSSIEDGNQNTNSVNKSPVKWVDKSKSVVGDLRDAEEMSNFIAEQVIGRDEMFEGPLGWRHCVYVDTTASGKPLKLIEDFLHDKVLPWYANTHTTTSHTAMSMSKYRENARRCVRDFVGANKEDVVLFCGSGSTSAINKLVHILNITKDERAIVFVGPHEHHSNLLPWRETGSMMINVPENDSGRFDAQFLEKELQSLTSKGETKGRRIFGCFSAGSNVTGVTTDDVAITQLIHDFGGLCFWDYAAAAPHVKVQMNPTGGTNKLVGSKFKPEGKGARKDALYFSGHKFPGGPQTPGILVVKEHVFKNPVPHNGGGGTVFFVTPEKHVYLQDKEEVQEGGTPAIVESIRLGLVMSLNRAIGSENIVSREAFLTKKALRTWSKTPGIIILGPTDAGRLPIVSFVIEHLESGFHLHQNFVVALLNDLFGIQCRGGCMCAGPYSQILLGIDIELAEEFERVLSTPVEPRQSHSHGESNFEMIYRPGFSRISFPFEATNEEVDFVIKAVQIVAQHGWKLLSRYKVSPKTGEFKHWDAKRTQKPPENFHLDMDAMLSNANKVDTNPAGSKSKPKPPTNHTEEFSSVLKNAQKLFDSIQMSSQRPSVGNLEPTLNPRSKHLRWFMLPSDAADYLWSGAKEPTKAYFKFAAKKLKSSQFSSIADQYKMKGINASTSSHWTESSIPYQLEQFWTSEMNREQSLPKHHTKSPLNDQLLYRLNSIFEYGGFGIQN